MQRKLATVGVGGEHRVGAGVGTGGRDRRRRQLCVGVGQVTGGCRLILRIAAVGTTLTIAVVSVVPVPLLSRYGISTLERPAAIEEDANDGLVVSADFGGADAASSMRDFGQRFQRGQSVCERERGGLLEEAAAFLKVLGVMVVPPSSLNLEFGVCTASHSAPLTRLRLRSCQVVMLAAVGDPGRV